MKLKHLILPVIIMVLVAGCYEMKQDEKGRTVKINRITGEVSVIEGDRIVKLKDELVVKAEQDALKKLAETKFWPAMSVPILGGANAMLRTKWNDGDLYYQFFVDKNLRMKGAYYAWMAIELQDGAGFKLEEIRIPVSTMTGNVGGDGKTIASMENKGQKPMSKDTYKRISEWTVTWGGFDK